MRFRLSTNVDPSLTLAVPTTQGEPLPQWPPSAAAFPTSLLRAAREEGFLGKPGETLFVTPAKERPARKLLLAGSGSHDTPVLRRSAAAAFRKASAGGLKRMAFLLPGIRTVNEEIREATESMGLAAYRYDRHKSRPSPSSSLQEIVLVSRKPATEEARQSLRYAEAAVRAVDFARDLINEPPSMKTPESIGKLARSLAKGGIKVRVFHKPDLIRMKAHALLGVNRGSAHPPVLIHLHYRPAGKPKRRLALVGKGITFDSGGLSLKPADGMMTMKYDMAGAASVLGVFSVLASLKPSVEVHGIAAVTENMPGPDAYKPGDVLRAMNGKTIEVLNTDAEGRVVLADALSFASRLPIDEIIDVATLTGAASVALGKSIAAVMTNDDDVMGRLKKAAKSAGEKVWRLPLEKDYRDHITSKVADLKNIGNPGEAGTIIAGLFLEEFVGGKTWAHIDMASVGWSKEGTLFSPHGATGTPVRTLLNYVMGFV